MSDESTNYEWAQDLADKHVWIVHLMTRVVGRVVEVGSVNDAHGNPQPTIMLEEGHSFHAVRENFLPISQSDVFAYRQMVDVVRTMTKEVAVRFASRMEQFRFEVLFGAALTTQAIVLGRGMAAELAEKGRKG